MKNQKLLRKQTKLLRSGKGKHLGFFEAIAMRFIGRRDGKIGLPKQSSEDNWNSPRLIKETDAYLEFSAKTWGDTQIYTSRTHEEIGRLIDEITQKERQLEELKQDKPVEPEASYFSIRKYGEELLSDDQIHARRTRELQKKNASYFNKIIQLEQQISERYTELYKLKNIILEQDNITRLICERLMNHTKQRIDAYWNAALRTHPLSKQMPAIPLALPKSDAEITYISGHKNLEEAMAQLINRRERLMMHKINADESITEGVA